MSVKPITVIARVRSEVNFEFIKFKVAFLIYFTLSYIYKTVIVPYTSFIWSNILL